MDREKLEDTAMAAVELLDRRYADDFSAWLFGIVKTQDEASQQLLDFPDKDYLRDVAWALQHRNMIIFPKSRRMLASWIVAAYASWRVRYKRHNAVFWQSLTEEKAAYVVDQRIKLIEDNLPSLFSKKYTPLKTKSGLVGKLTFDDTDSYVKAIPQGDDVIRSYTPSVLICDEIDFMPEGNEAIKAALSTVEKNSQIILITTSDGPQGVVARLCKDVGLTRWKQDAYKVPGEEFLTLHEIKHPSGWSIIPIHYTHDTDKADAAWIEKHRGMYDREEDWDREMELDFTAQRGALAYPSFSRGVHVRKSIKISPTLPILLACDFNVDPCVFEICQIRNGYLMCCDEIVLGPTDVKGMVVEFRNLYPNHPAGIIVYGDSNGLRRNVQTNKSEYDLMKIHFGGYPSSVEFRVPRAHPNSKARINSLNHKLKGKNDKPSLFISEECNELIEDLQDVTLKPDGKDVLKIYKTDNPYSRRTHASDALSYLTFREFPVADEAIRAKLGAAKKRRPLSYGKLLGEI